MNKIYRDMNISPFLYLKKHVKYSLLHQLSSDSHDTGTVRTGISYPFATHCDYISMASLP